MERIDAAINTPQYEIPALKYMETRSYRKGEYIYRPGERAVHTYIVFEGVVRIGKPDNKGSDRTSAVCYKNEIFGEAEFLNGQTRTNYAQAMEENTMIFVISSESIIDGLYKNENNLFRILKLMAAKINKLEKRIDHVKHLNAEERLLDFIYDLANRNGVRIGCFEVMIKNTLKHKDIADIIGTTRQTVTTILNRLKKNNLIYFDSRKILIRDSSKIKT